MKAWLAETFADEEGPMAIEGRNVIIQGSKEEVRAIAEFAREVADHLESNDYCHMHLSDSMKNWNKKNHIDIQLNVEKESD